MKKRKLLKVVLLSSLLFGSTTLALTGCEDDKLEITLESNDVTTAHPGDTIQLTFKVNDTEVGLPSFVVVEGSDYASVSATGVLTINENCPANTEVKVKATIGKTESNVITINVEVIEVTALTISSSTDTLDIERKQEVTINTQVTPNNATNKNVQYTIVDGASYATLSTTGLLKVNADTPIGSIIKVKVNSGAIQSNELVFTVIETQDSEFDVMLNSSQVTIDSTSSQTSYTLNPTAYDADANYMRNATFTYQVMEGTEYVTVSSSGVITPIGHGQARIRAKVAGSNAYAECTVNSIVPPTTIELQSEYEGKTRYGFGQSGSMDFVVTGKGSVLNQPVASTYKYQFYLNDSTVADPTLATFNTDSNTITFATKTINNKVKIEVSSNTGASKETTRTFTVDVNNGVNIKNMNELVALTNRTDAVINLTGDCVVTDADIVDNSLAKYIFIFNNNFTMYGNGHTIDLSNVTIRYDRVGGGNNFFTITNEGNTTNNKVNIYNLDLRGNVGVDATYGTSDESPINGGFSRGILIRGANKSSVVAYLDEGNSYKPGHSIVDMDDVKISGFKIGLRVDYALSGQIANITLENNHQGGAEIAASILTFNNINIGKNGTTGIELTPDRWDTAGLNFNTPQTITFTGKVTCINQNDFATQYIAHDDSLSGLGQIISGLLATVDTQYQELLVDESLNNSFNWFLLIFNNPTSENASERDNGTVVFFQEENGTYKNINTEIAAVGLTEEQCKQIKFVSMDAVYGSDYGTIVVVNQKYQGN